MRMTIVGANPHADGAECVIFGHVGRRSHVFAPISPTLRDGDGGAKEFSSYGGWEVRAMRPGDGREMATALVGAIGRNCRSTGRVLVVSHRWSGVLRIDDVARRYAVDLYSPQTRLVLLDMANEIVVDVTGLAAIGDGVMELPPMTPERIVGHVLDGAWFRLVERDAGFEPSLARRALEAWRGGPDGALKARLVASLLPLLAARAAAPTAPAAPAEPGWRDEFRLLAAAIDGLAARAR